jgi:hypothetical protein
MVKFIIPWTKGVTDRYVNDDKIIYFQAVRIPNIQGGKEPRTIGNTAMTLRQIKDLAEMLGDRLRVLANSCFPEWDDNVHELCAYLNNIKGHMVVAKMGFAAEVRAMYPDITLHSSVIMNFYNSIEEILESPLFDTVGGSEFYNDDTEKMIEVIPEKHRKRVFYLLRGCVWSPACVRHYELPSMQYKDPTITEIFSKSSCVGKKWLNIKFEELLDAGFSLFKFGDRTPTLERTLEMEMEYYGKLKTWELAQKNKPKEKELTYA